MDDAPRREFGALKLLAPLDVAPQPVLCLSSVPPLGPVVVYEYMEGEMWDRRKPSAAELAQLAAISLQVNAVRGESLTL